MTTKQTQDQIIRDFATRSDWFDKYEYLISLGKELEPQDEAMKTDENRISGCQSEVWVAVEQQSDGRIRILADSDALITKGIIALLLQVLNDRAPQEIMETDLYFIEEIGLKSNLSPSRSNGLAAILQSIRSRVQACVGFAARGP